MADPYKRIHNHLDEYRDYIKSQPQRVRPDEAIEMTSGFLSTIGFHDHHVPVFDVDQFTYRFPFLDEYWTRPGVVYIDPDEMSRFDTRRFQTRLFSCLAEADRQGRLSRLIDKGKVSNVRALIDRGV